MSITNPYVVVFNGMTKPLIEISLLIYSNVITFDLIISLFGKEAGVMASSSIQAIA